MSDRPTTLRADIAAHLRVLAELGVTELRVPAAGRGASGGVGGTSGAGREAERRGSRPDRALSERTTDASAGEPGGRPASSLRGPVVVSRADATGKESSGAAAPRHQAPETQPRVGRRLAGASGAGDFMNRDLGADAARTHPGAGPAERLESLRADTIGDCIRCKLSAKRKTIVFGSGNPDAGLMFIGEGPGADEDEQGLPFVGRAGQLLTKMIESMVVGGKPLTREDVYIANIIKCRPPGNRDPEPDEIEACEGFLFEQIAIVSPRVIVALGAFSARTLLRSRAPISALRGRFHEYRGRLLMPTFHPAYVLRNYTPETRRTVYEDLKKAAAELECPPGRR